MSANGKDRKYTKKGITPEKLLAYIETKAGKGQDKVGADLGVSSRTIHRWAGEIEDYIKQCPEYKEAGSRIAEMIPSAFQVYKNRLTLDDLNAARDVLKMAVIFVERKSTETKDSDNTDGDLWDELRGLVSGSDTTGNDGASDSQGDQDSPGTEAPTD